MQASSIPRKRVFRLHFRSKSTSCEARFPLSNVYISSVSLSSATENRLLDFKRVCSPPSQCLKNGSLRVHTLGIVFWRTWSHFTSCSRRFHDPPPQKIPRLTIRSISSKRAFRLPCRWQKKFFWVVERRPGSSHTFVQFCDLRSQCFHFDTHRAQNSNPLSPKLVAPIHRLYLRFHHLGTPAWWSKYARVCLCSPTYLIILVTRALLPSFTYFLTRMPNNSIPGLFWCSLDQCTFLHIMATIAVIAFHVQRSPSPSAVASSCHPQSGDVVECAACSVR